jgi:hypothetical protein
VQTAQRQRLLAALSDARNAIAHDDHAKINELAADGYLLSRLATLNRVRAAAEVSPWLVWKH